MVIRCQWLFLGNIVMHVFNVMTVSQSVMGPAGFEPATTSPPD